MAKNGYYSDGYFKNDVIPNFGDGVTNAFVFLPVPRGSFKWFRPHSNYSPANNSTEFIVTKSVDDQKMRLYSWYNNAGTIVGGVNISGPTGSLYNGFVPMTNGKAYIRGELANGYGLLDYEDIFYKDGVPYTGAFDPALIGTTWPANNPSETEWPANTVTYPSETMYFRSGVPAAGTANGFQYGSDGKLANDIIINGKMYSAGLPASGFYIDYETGSYRMRLYKVGKPYTGFSIEAIDNDGNYPANSLVLNSTGRVGLLTYVYANWLNYSGMNDPINSNGCYFYNGELANGEINNKIWTNGVFDPSGGDIISNGRLFRNGVPFGGKLVMNNGNVTFGDTSILLVPGELTTKDAFFAAGVLMHGFLGGKIYNHGSPDLTAGSKQQTLIFNNGIILNGFVGDEKFVNGKAW